MTQQQFENNINSRILAQIADSPNGGTFRTMMITLTQSFFDFTEVMDEIYDAFEIETAVGDQLDKIGGFVGLPRSGFNDADYRRNINIQISIIRSKIQRIDGLLGNWNGTVNNILSIARTYIGEAVVQPIILTQIPPYSFEIQIPGNLELVEVTQLFQFIKRALYAGVLGYVIFLLGENNLWALGGYEDGVEVYSGNASGSLYEDLTTEFLVDDGTLDFILFDAEYAISASCTFGYGSPFSALSLVLSSSFTPDNTVTNLEYWSQNGAWTDLNPAQQFALSGSDRIVSTQTWDIPDDWAQISFPPEKFSGTDSSLYLYTDASALTQSLGTQFWGDSFNCRLFNSNRSPAEIGDYGQMLLRDYKFGGIFFDFSEGVVGVGGEVEFQYWNGTSWAALQNVVDQTDNFTTGSWAEQIVSWDIPDDWATLSPGIGPTGYAVRWIVTTDYTTSPQVLQGSIWNVQNGDYKNWARLKIASGTLPLINSPEAFYGFYGDNEQSLQGYWIENAIEDEAHWAMGKPGFFVWQVTLSDEQFWIESGTETFWDDSTNFLPFRDGSVTGSYAMFGSVQPFEQMTVDVDVAGTDGEVTWQYLSADGWENLAVTDDTDGFKNAGVNSITFEAPDDWEPMIQNGLTQWFDNQGQVRRIRAALNGSSDLTTTFFNSSACSLAFSGSSTYGEIGSYAPLINSYNSKFGGVVMNFSSLAFVNENPDFQLTWKYWNGTEFTPLQNVVDQTENYSISSLSQSITWDIPDDWEISPNTIGSVTIGQGYAVVAESTGPDNAADLIATVEANYIYNEQTTEPMYYIRAVMEDGAQYTVYPEISEGTIGTVEYGYWDEGFVNDEGIWSLALSTNFPSISEKNDNDPWG